MKTFAFASAAALLSVGSFIAWGPPLGSPAHAIPVFDSANYAQSLIQAARALEQINNQVKSLQNEATMLQGLEKNLKTIDFRELQELTSRLQEIDRLMGKAQGIGFKVSDVDRQYEALFPKDWDGKASDSRITDARSRLDTAVAAFRQSMSVQARVIENVEKDAEVLSALAAKSQAAEGSLQAQQATNQLLALAAKQQIQLQSLLAAQFRSDSLEAARRARSEEEARSATRRFLGNGTAYEPTSR